MSTLCIDGEGSLWACGRNTEGQLGLGNNLDEVRNLCKVPIDNKFLSVFTSGTHTVALDCSGDLWSCGLNKQGQLGVGDNLDRNVFTKIDLDEKINCVSGWYGRTVALDVNGDIWFSGIAYEISGYKINVFTKFEFPVKFKSVKCGFFFDVLLDNNGNLWSWGCNLHAKWIPNQIQTKPIQLNSSINFVKLACGEEYLVGLDKQGHLWSMGNNQCGQLGHGDYENRKTLTQIESPQLFVDLACGMEHSIFLDVDGNIWSCGSNGLGKIGIKMQKNHDNHFNTLNKLSYPKHKFVNITCGDNFTMALNENGYIEACGANYNSQLGCGSFSTYKDQLKSTYFKASVLMNCDKITSQRIKSAS